MATVTRMTPQEHTEIFQTISESIVADLPADPPAPEEKPPEPDVDPRALRGALHLDEHHPGWANKINLEMFQIQDVNNCVVGQLVGYYDDNAHKLFPVGSGYNPEAEDFGIMPNGNSDELNRSWEILIAERQTKEVVPS